MQLNGPVVTFGEIMLRLNPPGHQRISQADSFEAFYGGGEANVAASLAGFGLTVKYVTRLPKNELGETCTARLMGFGVDTRHISWGGDRIGIYFLETGAAQRPSKVIYDRSQSSFATIQPGMVDWEAVFEDAQWFHWTGITPGVSSAAAEVCQEALEAAKKYRLTISCDLNYRAKLWRWTESPGVVMRNLVKYCDLVIGNEEDAHKLFGITAPDTSVTTGSLKAENFLPVCRELVNQLNGPATIAITLRGSVSASINTWSAVLWKEDQYFTSPSYQIIPVIDRVGGGDAFAAGLIYSLITDKDPQSALNFAAAASCLKHSIPGDINLVSAREVEQLAEGDQSGRISR